MRMLYATRVVRHVVDLLIRVNATLCFVAHPDHIMVYGYDPRWHVYMKVRLIGEVTDAACDGVRVAVCSATLKQRINALLDDEFELEVSGGQLGIASANYRCALGVAREDAVPEQALGLDEWYMVRVAQVARAQLPRQIDGMQTSTGMVTFRVRDGALSIVNREDGAETTCVVPGEVMAADGAGDYEGSFTADWFKKIISAKVLGDAFVIFSGDFMARSGKAERAPMVVRYEAPEYEFYLMLTEGVCRSRPCVAANRRGHKQAQRLQREIDDFERQ